MNSKQENQEAKKVQKITQRQKNLLRGKVTGLKLRELAEQHNYKTVGPISRFMNSPEGRAELIRLQNETSETFLREMRQITLDAVNTLKDQMLYGSESTASSAAKFILSELSLPLAQQGLIPIESIQPLEPLDAEIIPTKE